MKLDSALTLLAKGLASAGWEVSRSILSARTASGLWKSVYTYPLSPDFRRVSRPQKGTPLASGACVIFNTAYCVPLFGLEGLPPYDTHRFGNIYRRLLSRKVLTQDQVYVPDQVSDDDLLMVHGEAYIESLADGPKVSEILEVPVIGMLPKFAVNKIVSAFRYPAGGTLLAARLAMELGLAVNLGGGFHHARPHRGDGFCLIADIPVAIRKIREENGPLRVLVIDLDVHQGDGTIACMAEDRDTFTFSMHQQEIKYRNSLFPLH